VRAAVLTQLGEAETRALDPAAPDHLEAAVNASADSDSRRRALLELGRAQLVPGRLEDAVRAFEAALSEGGEDREFTLRTEAELASAQLNLRAFPQAVERLARYRELPGETTGERMVLAVSAFAAVQENRPAAEVRELAGRALADGLLLEEQTSASLILWEAVIAVLMADGYELAERILDAAVADARERGWPVAFAAASCLRAWLAMRRGRIREAEAEARAADEVRRQYGLHPTAPMATAFLSSGSVGSWMRPPPFWTMPASRRTSRTRRSSSCCCTRAAGSASPGDARGRGWTTSCWPAAGR
jgi:tetratricopeptide (TPR) repeat protein